MKKISPLLLLLFFTVACHKQPAKNHNPAQDIKNYIEASKANIHMPDTALALIKQAKQLADIYEIEQYNGLILNQMGWVYQKKNMTINALKCHLSASVSSAKANDKGYANHQLGVLYTQMEQYNKAITHFNEAVIQYTKLSKNNWLVLSQYQLGKTYLQHKDYVAAEKSFLAALRLAEKISYSVMVQYSLDRLAEVCIQTNRFIEAKTYLDTIQERFQLDDTPALISYLLLLGNTAEELDQTQKAAQYYTQAANVIRQHPANHLYLYGMFTYGQYLQKHSKNGIAIWEEALANHQHNETKYASELMALSQALGNWYMANNLSKKAAKYIQQTNLLQAKQLAVLSELETQYKLAQAEKVQDQVMAQYAPKPTFWQTQGLNLVVGILVVYAIVLSVAYRKRYIKLKTYRKLVMQLIKPHVDRGRQ